MVEEVVEEVLEVLEVLVVVLQALRMRRGSKRIMTRPMLRLPNR